MSKTIISEGKTTTEAIEKGLKQLKTTKDRVDIKVLKEEDKRSFFSILSPRVVKVELTLKEGIEKKINCQEEVKYTEKRQIIYSKEELEVAKKNISTFLDKFIKQLPEGTTYVLEANEDGVSVNLKHPDLGYLIGYRGETLYSLQNILSSIANKNIEKRVRIILDIEGYKERRIKTLEELAEKIAQSVIRNKKSVTLEPMQSYERKVIHSKLQENPEIDTKSIGEEPRRRIIVSLK